MKRLAALFGIVSLFLGSLHLVQVRVPVRGALLLGAAKVVAEVFAPLLAVTGLLAAKLGLRARSPLAVAAGLAGAWLSTRYVRQVTGAAGDLAGAFGPGWGNQLPPALQARMLPTRWSWLAPAPPPVEHRRDIPFATVPLPPVGPTGDRPIYCDLWLPHPQVPRSGLGLIYLHGSAWYFGDKDQGTRPFFRHLAGQGHVVMDVAYRMCPETDFRGMVGDAKRAIAWLKEHAQELGINPERVVISGGSAGGHLALLAAYTADDAALHPDGLGDAGLSVRAVVAYYPPSDFLAMDEYYGWQARKAQALAVSVDGPLVPPGPGASWRERRRFARLQAQRLNNLADDMFGGYPQDVPDAYRLASPVTHVGPHCPPTLLIHGTHDMLVPIGATRALAQALRNAGVPVDYLELPATEHGFDLFLPRISPPSQASLYEVERFLALMA